MARSKSRQTIFLTAFILLLVFGPIAFFVSKYASLSRAAWYDASWGYRKPVALTYSGSTLTNEDVLIQLDTAALVTGNKLQSDCDDIRIVDSDETTVISYWIEAGCNTTTTQIWARVPSIPNGGKTIYIYYGNASATNAEQSWAGTFTLLNAAACPTGWTRNTNFDSKFPYGAATSGTTGGSSSHSHGHVSTTSTSSPYSENIAAEGGSGGDYINEHNHTIGTNINTNSSVLPPYIDTVFCYKSKLDINSGLIALFTSTPTGWTRSSAFDSRFPRGASSYGATGGSATHTHTFPGETSSAAPSIGFNPVPMGSFVAAGGHTHVINSGTTAAGNNTPPYLDLLFSAKDSTGVAVSGLISLTTALPPLGWTRYVALDSNFPRGNTTSGSTGGTTTHTHTVSLNTGMASNSIEDYDWGFGADPSHTHTGSATTDAQSNLPPYYSIIYAQRKTPAATTGTPGSELPQPTSTPASNSLLSYLKLDEGTGTTAQDSAGNNNSGSITAPSWLSADQCISNSCVSLNGTSSVISITNSLSTKSISFWVKPATTTEQLLDLNGLAYVNLVSGTITLTGFTSPTIYVNGTVKSTLTAGTWQHVAITTDTAINGSAIKIGQIASDFGQIVIDEFRIYNYARSASQVLTDFNAVGSSNANAVFGDTSSVQLPSGLLGYWKLDETSGAVAADSSGNGYNGTVYGTGSFTSQGYLNNGFSQAGATPNRIDIGDQAAFEIQQFTISAWVKLNGACNFNYCGILSKGSSGNIGYGMGIRNSTGYRLEMNIRDIQYEKSLATINIGEWHHLTATVNGSKITLYIDGNFDKEVNQTQTPTFATEALKIANQNSGNDLYFNGIVDEVRFYNRALSATEVKTVANYLPTKLRQSLVWYKFDESNGTVANNAITPSTNGTITSGAWSLDGKNNNALSFTASTSVTATITDPAYLNTISVWLYPTTSVANKNLVTASKLTTDSSSRPVYGNCTGTAIALNQWTHLVAVSNGSGSCTIYQNGLPTATGNTGVTFGTSLNIGATSYTGKMDDFRLYNYALTANEIKQDLNASSTTKSGSSTQTISGTTTSIEYCLPGDTTTCTLPVTEYNLEEGKGQSLIDLSGSGNHATTFNSPTWLTGKVGKAVQFDGSSSYASTSSTPLTSLTNWSLEAWIKPANLNQLGVAVYNGKDTGGYGFGVGNGSGGAGSKLVGLLGGVVWVDSGYTFPNANQWYHIVMTRDTTTTRLYVNGKQTTGTVTNAPKAVQAAISLGAELDSTSLPSRYFSGAVDQVRFYNYVRSVSQINYSYDKRGMLMWWKLDECQGSTIQDSSGNNLTGTLSAGAAGSQTAIGTCSTASTAWGNGVTGKLNSSVKFDGTDDSISVGAPITTNTTNITMSSWIKWDGTSTGNPQIIYFNGNSGSSGYGYYLNTSNKLILLLGGRGNYDPSYTPPVNTWTHIAVTRDTANWKMYINGIETPLTLNGISTIITPAGQAQVGGLSGSQSFSGQIDDVRFYNYPVTAEQVKQIYTNGGMSFSPATGIP